MLASSETSIESREFGWTNHLTRRKRPFFNGMDLE